MKERQQSLSLRILFAAFLCGCSGSDEPVETHLPPGFGPPSLDVIWLSPEVYSSVDRVNDTTLRLSLSINNPLDSSAALDTEVNYDWSVSYDLFAAAGGLGPHEFVVGGIARNGDLVLEHFDLEMPAGSQVVADTTSTPPSFSIAGGGSYLPPSQRVAANPPVREELYRGAGLGSDVLLANDPLRRFTYVCSRDLEKLFLVPWDPSASIQEYTLESSPSLLGLAKSMKVQQHSSEGNKLKITLDTQQGPFRYLLLSDYDDDGLLDGDVPFTREQYASSGYPQLWETDYVRHTSILGPS